MSKVNSVFLDTTIQIVRLVRQAEQEVIRDIENTVRRYNKSASSTYVLKEFMARAVPDFIFFYNTLRENCKLSYLFTRIGRLRIEGEKSWARRHKIFLSTIASFWINPGDANKKGFVIAEADEIVAEKVRYWLKQAIEDLADRFISTIDEISDETKCIYADQRPIRKKDTYEYHIRGKNECNREVMQCNILEFFKIKREHINKIVNYLNTKSDTELSNELKNIREELKYVLKYPDRLFGLKKCKKVADAVITLEVPSEATFYSGNPKESKPLCEALGVKLENLSL